MTVRRALGPPPNNRFGRGAAEQVAKGNVKFTFRNTSTGQVAHNFTVVSTLGGGKRLKSQTLAAGKSQTRA